MVNDSPLVSHRFFAQSAEPVINGTMVNCLHHWSAVKCIIHRSAVKNKLLLDIKPVFFCIIILIVLGEMQYCQHNPIKNKTLTRIFTSLSIDFVFLIVFSYLQFKLL